MQKIRTILIDDELQASEALELLIGLYCPQIQIMGIAQTFSAAKQLIAEVDPELVFLDIQMQEGNGFQLLESLQPVTFKTIFVTGYDQFAIKAIRHQAHDYLVKPVDYRELQEAVNRLKQDDKKETEELETTSGKIGVPGVNGVDFIEIDEVLYCRAEGSATIIMLANGKRFVASKNLAVLENALPKHQFFRSHRQYLVNLSKIKKYHFGTGGSVRLANDEILPVSRRKKSDLLNMLNKL